MTVYICMCIHFFAIVILLLSGVSCPRCTPFFSLWCRHVLQQAYVLWIDNYSKILRRSIPTAQQDLYKNCLWTGTAAFFSSNDRVLDLSIAYAVDGSVVRAMPLDITTQKDSVKAGVMHVLSACRYYYDSSLVKKYDIRSVPVKIDTKVYPETKAVVDHPRNTLKYVHPIELVEVNVGGNTGLVYMLRQLLEKNGMLDGSCPRYMILNVDENIFWRTLKVR